MVSTFLRDLRKKVGNIKFPCKSPPQAENFGISGSKSLENPLKISISHCTWCLESWKFSACGGHSCENFHNNVTCRHTSPKKRSICLWKAGFPVGISPLRDVSLLREQTWAVNAPRFEPALFFLHWIWADRKGSVASSRCEHNFTTWKPRSPANCANRYRQMSCV